MMTDQGCQKSLITSRDFLWKAGCTTHLTKKSANCTEGAWCLGTLFLTGLWEQPSHFPLHPHLTASFTPISHLTFSVTCGSNSAAAEHLRCRGKLSETYLVSSEQEVPSAAFYEQRVQGREGVNCKIQLCQAPDSTGSKRLPAPSYSASTLRQHLIQQQLEAAEKAPADFVQQLTHAWVKTGGKWSPAEDPAP